MPDKLDKPTLGRSSKFTHIPMDVETKVVALLARGDTHKEIAAATGIHYKSVRIIKKRNIDNLQIIEQKMLVKATNDAMSNKLGANQRIGQRLKRDDKVTQILDKAIDDYMTETITIKEYTEIIKRVKELSVNELVSISKAMHDQTNEKENKPEASQSDMAALAAAIRSGDETKITQVVFNGNSQNTPATPI